MQSLSSLKSKANELTKSTNNKEVLLLAELIASLAENFEEVERKANQANAEAKRVKSELKRLEREPK